jgi:hypothetical protein
MKMSTHLDTILLVIGIYTLLALGQVFAPRLFLAKVTFGADTSDPLALLLARHWALLAALVGALLVYAAYHSEVQRPAMAIAAVEKLALAGLIFFGGWKRTPTSTRTAVVDAVMGLVLLLCLAGL